MRPAVGVIGSGRAVPAKALTAAAPIQPYRYPGSGRTVVQNHRIAKGAGKWTLTAAISDAGKGDSSVVGHRCARKIVVVSTSRIVVGHNDLVGIIRVRRG